MQQAYRLFSTVTFGGALMIISALMPAQAAKPAHIKPFSLEVSHINTAKASLPGDNSLNRQSWSVNAGIAFPLPGGAGGRLSLEAARLDYQLGEPMAYGGGWDNIQRYRASLGVFYRLTPHWMLMVTPKLQYAWAQGASGHDSQGYGLSAAAMYQFDSGNVLGLGAAYLNDIGQVRTIPYLAIKWQLSDRLALANPFRAGFSGPAGLELRYRLTPAWQFGVGSSRRVQHFLTAMGPQQEAEIEEWVGFARASWQVQQNIAVNFYGGYYFGSSLNLPDTSVDIDGHAAMAVAVKFSF